MLQAYEGYLDRGRLYSPAPLMDIKGRGRVIITVLDEPVQEKSDTWSELDSIIQQMAEKPRIEDFPRCKFGRDIINFKEV